MDNKNLEERFEQQLVQKDSLLDDDENIHLFAEDMLNKHLNKTVKKN